MSKAHSVGIYCRLSINDATNTQKENYIGGDESCSIENQRLLLSQFAMLQGWIVAKVYIDDGYTGKNFNRPGFIQMIEDAKSGVIDLILVNDLSRLGRDYVEVGRYTDVVFPSWGCRFIALLDEIDTAKDDNDMMHFRALMNDYYLKDLSVKIKRVFREKERETGFINGRPPYGYLRSAKKEHLLIPDKAAAPTIRRIFALRAEGMSYSKIAGTLNKDGVQTASDYWATMEGKEISKPALWYLQVIRNILRSEFYIGTIVNNKKRTISHKSEKRIKTREDEWIRHENAHEAIIDRATWDKVQELEHAAIEKGKSQSKRKPSLFSRKLFCLDCGASLSAQTMGHTKNGVWKREGTNYSCHRHLLTGRAVCSNHTIGENPLKAIVLGELHCHAQSISLDENSLLDKLKRQMAVDNSDNQLFLQREVRQYQGLLDESNRIVANLYEDKVAGKISPETFVALIDKNEQERKLRQAKFDEANSQLTAIQDKLLCISQWAEVIRKHTELSDLTRADIEELIDRIEVGESDYSSGKRVQEIRIYWRFAGHIGT